MLQHDPKLRPRVEDLEILPGLNVAMNNAKSLITEYNNSINNSKLKMKEDALKVKEEELKVKEDSLKLKEETIKLKELSLQSKEESLHSREVLLFDRERELSKKEAIIRDQMLVIKKDDEIENYNKKETDMKLSNDINKGSELQSKAIGFNIHIDHNNTIFNQKNATTTITTSNSNSSNNTIRNVEIDGALRRAKEVLSSCHAKDISTKRPSIEIDIPLNKKVRTGTEDCKENLYPNNFIPRAGIQLSTEYSKENQFNKIRLTRPSINDGNKKRMKYEN